MPNTTPKSSFTLAVLLFVVTAFLLSAMPVSGKVALGSSGFSHDSVLENGVSNALIALEKSLSYRLAALGNSNVPENIPPKVNTGDGDAVEKAVEDSAKVTKSGYHATHPEAAEAILQGGFRQGTKPGRLGSGGTYVNNTPKGAIAEFAHHNPGVTPKVLKVDYNPGTNASASVAPRNYVDQLPLNVDSISAPSVRAPGTINTNVLNGSARATEILP